MTIPFMGETMTCSLCARVKQSDPSVESNWRIIELNGQKFYVCTKHFPPDERATADDFAKAYYHVIKSLINRKARGKI